MKNKSDALQVFIITWIQMLSVSSAVICGTLTEDIVIVFSGEWNCVKIDLAYFFAKCEFWLFIFKIIGRLNTKISICYNSRTILHVLIKIIGKILLSLFSSWFLVLCQFLADYSNSFIRFDQSVKRFNQSFYPGDKGHFGLQFWKSKKAYYIR